MAAKALRPIASLFGVAYASGADIPDAVIARMSPQVIKSLVSRGDLEVAGMESAAATSGIAQHLGARIDRQHDHTKKLQAGHTENADRIAVLEAQVAALISGKAAKTEKKTRRQARTGESKD